MESRSPGGERECYTVFAFRYARPLRVPLLRKNRRDEISSSTFTVVIEILVAYILLVIRKHIKSVRNIFTTCFLRNFHINTLLVPYPGWYIVVRVLNCNYNNVSYHCSK